MHAAVCPAYGPPEVVRIEELPSPAPGPGQVRVRVHAAAVNFPDVLLIANQYQMTVTPPFVPGSEFAGDVVEVAGDVTDIAVGDRVFGTVLVGAFAEEAVTAIRQVVGAEYGARYLPEAPRRYQTKVEKFDSRRGGEWRVANVGADGSEHWFRGVNHDVVTPERICATFEYEGVPGHVALQTATFEALGNKTRLVTHQVFESVMDRDGMVASGMQEGADESIERLSELLEKMKAGRS